MPNQISFITPVANRYSTVLTVVNRYVVNHYCGESLNYLTLRYMYIIPGPS